MTDFTSNLTLGEISMVERISGASIKSLSARDQPMGEQLVAIAYVVKRRTDQNFTRDDAEALTFADLNEILGIDDDEDDELEDDGPKAPTPDSSISTTREATPSPLV